MSQNQGPISRLLSQSMKDITSGKAKATPKMTPTAADHLLGRVTPPTPQQPPNPIRDQQRANTRAVQGIVPQARLANQGMASGAERKAANEARRANTPGTVENTRELVRRQVTQLPIPQEYRAQVESLIDSALHIRTTYLDPATGLRRRVDPLASGQAIRETGMLDPQDAMEVVELLKTEEGLKQLQAEVRNYRDQRVMGSRRARGVEQNTVGTNNLTSAEQTEILAAQDAALKAGVTLDQFLRTPAGAAMDLPNLRRLVGRGENIGLLGQVQAEGKSLEDPTFAGLGAVIDRAAEADPRIAGARQFLRQNPDALTQGVEGLERASGMLGLGGPAVAATRGILSVVGLDTDSYFKALDQFNVAGARGAVEGMSAMVRIPQLLGSQTFADLANLADAAVAARDKQKPLDDTFFTEMGRVIGGVIPQIAPALLTGGGSAGASAAARMAASVAFAVTEAGANAAGGYNTALRQGENPMAARRRVAQSLPADIIWSAVLNRLGEFGEIGEAFAKAGRKSFADALKAGAVRYGSASALEGIQEGGQTTLENYIATGEIDPTRPEVLKSILLGAAVGGAMKGGLDLAPQQAQGAEVVPQRSAAASAPPVAESYQAREKEYQVWEARLEELEALLERASGDTMLPNGMPNPMSKAAIQRMISEHRKSRPAFFVIGESQPSAKPKPRTEPAQMPTREQLAAMNVGAEAGQVGDINALRQLQSEIDEWAAYRRSLGLESDPAQQVAPQPVQSAQPTTTPAQGTRATGADATIQTNFQDPQARAKAISESPIPGATEAAWSSGNEKIVVGVERIQEAVNRVGSTSTPKDKDVARLLTTMHQVRARAEAAGVDIDPSGELQGIEAQMRDLGYEVDPEFMAAGDAYDTNFKADVLDHIQAEGELRVHQQLKPGVRRDGRFISPPQIITIGYSEDWQSPEDDGGNAAQLPSPPDGTLPPTATTPDFPRTAPADMPRQTEPQQTAQAERPDGALQKEPWQMTRAEYARAHPTDSPAPHRGQGASFGKYQNIAGKRVRPLILPGYDGPPLAVREVTRSRVKEIDVVFAASGDVFETIRPVNGGDMSAGEVFERIRPALAKIISRYGARPDHWGELTKALNRGLPVPPEVLADYPDLAAKYAPQPAQPSRLGQLLAESQLPAPRTEARADMPRQQEAPQAQASTEAQPQQPQPQQRTESTQMPTREQLAAMNVQPPANVPDVPSLRKVAEGVGQDAAKKEPWQMTREEWRAGEDAKSLDLISAQPFGAGRGIVAFHGSSTEFSDYDPTMFGKATGAQSAALGAYFTDDPYVANVFGKQGEGSTRAAIIDIQNPIVFETPTYGRAVPLSERARHQLYTRNGFRVDTHKPDSFSQMKMAVARVAGKPIEELTAEDYAKWRESAQAQGYDGVWLKHSRMDMQSGTHDTWVVFEPQGKVKFGGEAKARHDGTGFNYRRHQARVEQALKDGLPVPPEVLADYPDLAAKYAPQPAQPSRLGQLLAESQLPAPRTEAAGSQPGRSLPPALAMRLVEAHRAMGRDVTDVQARKLLADKKEELRKGTSADPTERPKIRPKYAETLRQQIARLQQDLALWDEAFPQPPRTEARDSGDPKTFWADVAAKAQAQAKTNPVVVRTNTKQTSYSRPDSIRAKADGTGIQVREGQKWVNLTLGQEELIARQVGLTPPPGLSEYVSGIRAKQREAASARDDERRAKAEAERIGKLKTLRDRLSAIVASGVDERGKKVSPSMLRDLQDGIAKLTAEIGDNAKPTAPAEKPKESGTVQAGSRPAPKSSVERYFEAKQSAPDGLLAIRVGDFYEFYGDDAEKAAEALGITVTGRDTPLRGRVPMSGVPFHAVERYATRLAEAGYDLSIVDEDIEGGKPTRVPTIEEAQLPRTEARTEKAPAATGPETDGNKAINDWLDSATPEQLRALQEADNISKFVEKAGELPPDVAVEFPKLASLAAARGLNGGAVKVRAYTKSQLTAFKKRVQSDDGRGNRWWSNNHIALRGVDLPTNRPLNEVSISRVLENATKKAKPVTVVATVEHYGDRKRSRSAGAYTVLSNGGRVDAKYFAMLEALKPDSYVMNDPAGVLVAMKGKEPIGVVGAMAPDEEVNRIAERVAKGGPAQPAAPAEKAPAPQEPQLAQPAQQKPELAPDTARAMQAKQAAQQKRQGARQAAEERKSQSGFDSLPERSRQFFDKAFEAKDAAQLRQVVHPDNKAWRAEFERRTGLTLPKTVSGTNEVVAEFTGTPAPKKVDPATKYQQMSDWDLYKAVKANDSRALVEVKERSQARGFRSPVQWMNDTEKARDEEQRAKKAEAGKELAAKGQEARAEKSLQKEIAWVTGDGSQRNGTVQQFADDLLSRGYKAQAVQVADRAAVSKAEKLVANPPTDRWGYVAPKAQAEIDKAKKILRDPPTKTEYRAQSPESSFYSITKAQYDYMVANEGKVQPAQLAPLASKQDQALQEQETARKEEQAALVSAVLYEPGNLLKFNDREVVVQSYDPSTSEVGVAQVKAGSPRGTKTFSTTDLLVGGKPKYNQVTDPNGVVLWDRRLTQEGFNRVNQLRTQPKAPESVSPGVQEAEGSTAGVAAEYKPAHHVAVYSGKAVMSDGTRPKSEEFRSAAMRVSDNAGDGFVIAPDGSVWVITKSSKRAKPANAAETAEAVAIARNTFDGQASGAKKADTAGVAAEPPAQKQAKPTPQAPDILASPTKPAKKDTITVDGKERPRLNSNGKPIHPTDEGIINFWRWFGDSKVVDEQGRPLVVYHGTPDARFVTEGDAAFKTTAQRILRDEPNPAFFFTDSKRTASTYADDRRAWDYQNAEPAVFDTYVSLKNPKVLDWEGKEWRGSEIGDNYATGKLMGEGFDGLIIKNIKDPYNRLERNAPASTVFVATASAQIKSATGNQGTFNPSNPSILASPTKPRPGAAPAPMVALTPKPNGGAVPLDLQVDPLASAPGARAISIPEIERAIDDVYGRTHRGTSAKGTDGSYSVSSGARWVRDGKFLVGIHEAGHQTSYQAQVIPHFTGPAMDELRSGYFDGTIPDIASQDTADQERFAEFFLAWHINPKLAGKVAPTLRKEFEAIMDAHDRALFGKMKNLSGLIRAYQGQNDVQLAAANFIPAESQSLPSKIAKALKSGTWEKVKDNLGLRLTDEYYPVLAAIDRIVGTSLRKGRELLGSKNPETWIRFIPYTSELLNDGLINGMVDWGVSFRTGKLTRSTGSIKDLFAPLKPKSPEFMSNYTTALGYIAALRQVHYDERLKMDAAEQVAEMQPKAARKLADRIALAHAQIDRDLQIDLTNLAVQGKATKAATKTLIDAADARKDRATKALTARSKAGLTRYRNMVLREAAATAARSGIVAPGANGRTATDIARGALASIASDPETKAMVEAFAAEIRRHGDWQLSMMEHSGRLSMEQAERIRQRNPYWFPIDRETSLDEDLDEALGFVAGQKIGNAKNVIREFKGSQKSMSDVVGALVKRNADVLAEFHRNMAARTMVDWVEDRGAIGGKAGVFHRVPTEVGIKPKDTQFFVWRNGEKETWEADPGNTAFVAAIKSFSGPRMEDKWERVFWMIFETPTQVNKAFVTNSLPFMIRNLWRDTVHASIKLGLNPLAVFRPKSDFVNQNYDALAIGLGRSTDIISKSKWERNQAQMIKKASGEEMVILRPYRAAQDLREESERTPRKAVFDREFKKHMATGHTEVESALMAMMYARNGMTDFRQGGTTVRALSRMVMFLNASVQGTRTSLRAYRDDPVRTSLALAKYAGIWLAVEAAWAALGGEDEEKRLEQLDGYQRDMFWNFRIGGDNGWWLTIPKGHDEALGVGIIQRLALRVAGKDASHLQNTRNLARDTVLPMDDASDLFGGWLPSVELGFNRDWRTGKEIVPFYDQGPVHERSGTGYASTLGQALQRAFGNKLDARQWDHLIENSFGYYGRVTTSGSDSLRDGDTDALARAGIRFTGLNLPGRATNNATVLGVENYLRLWSKRPQAWSDAKGAFFDAKTEAERQEAGRKLIALAEKWHDKFESIKDRPKPARELILKTYFEAFKTPKQ